MNTNDVLSLNQRMHDWIQAYDQELEKDIAYFLRKHAVSAPSELEHTFEQLREEGRLLQIGVVGRVKAGKSSLLNALIFGGQNVLPRAATPMTAALTTLTFAGTFSAHVQFYSEADLRDIEGSAQRFQERLAAEQKRAADEMRRRRQHAGQAADEEAIWTAAGHAARRELQKDASLCAAQDQWERIQACGAGARALGAGQKLDAADAAALAELLRDYVGADGRYMPLTKSADIFLPLETLKGIRIIDTPGINDPVRSREQRTEALLKECDAVFIVSPAGQFLSEQDLEVMSRITQKEGVQELVLVASQIDNQLYGSDTCLPTLKASVDKVTGDLREHVVETLQRLTQQHPEMEAIFGSMLQNEKDQVLYTSGMCHSLSARWDEQHSWDASERKVWANLQTHYPDFFAAHDRERCRANLDLLGNTAGLLNVLERVRARKSEIIGQRSADLVRSKASALQELRTDLLAFIQQRSQEIKSADVDDLKAQSRKLDELVTESSFFLADAVAQRISAFRDQLEQQLTKELKNKYDGTKNVFSSNTSEETRRETHKRDSWAAKIANSLWGGGTEERAYRDFTLFWHPVRNALVEFASALVIDLSKISEDVVAEFRRSLIKEVTAVSRTRMENVSTALIIRSVQALVAKIDIPAFTLDSGSLEHLRGVRDTLCDSEAREFLGQASSKLAQLQHQAICQIRNLKGSVHKHLPQSFAEEFFKDMHARIRELEESVDNAVLALDRLRRMAKDLEAV